MILTLDTTFFIQHYFEADAAILAKTRRILTFCRKPPNQGVLSTMVLGEFYAEAHRTLGRDVAEKNFREVCDSGLKVVDLDAEAAHQAATLRRRYQEKIPWGDCIIAASAIISNSDYVVSEDPHFKLIREIKTRRLSELSL